MNVERMNGALWLIVASLLIIALAWDELTLCCLAHTHTHTLGYFSLDNENYTIEWFLV